MRKQAQMRVNGETCAYIIVIESEKNDWIFCLIQRDTCKVSLLIVKNRRAAEHIPRI